MKKKLILTLMSIMTLGGIVGCGSNETKTTSKSDGEKVEIEFWYGLGSEAGKEMESIIKDFNDSQKDVVVKGVQQADYDTTWKKVQAGIAAKKAPAVFITGSNVVQNFGGKDGVLADVEELTTSSDFKFDELLEVFTVNNKVDDKNYAVPVYGTTQIIYYNKDVLTKAGVEAKDVYSTWENVASNAKTIKEKADVDYGHMVMWGPNNLVDIALSSGGKILSEDGKKVMINSQEWIDSWDFIRKEISETKNMGVISGGQGWEYWYKTIDMVNNGKAGAYTGSSGDRANLDFSKIDAIPQPGFNGKQSKPVAGALNMAIPKIASDDEKKAAYQWMSYFTSSEVQSKWSQKIGYVPVRESVLENKEYKKFIEENPYANVAFEQSKVASPEFIDPTKGKITDALKKAADKIELQNVSAKEALDEAQKEAQEALDNVK